MKYCPHCERDLPIDEFGTACDRADGRSAYCKPCIRGKIKDFRARRRVYLKRKGFVISRVKMNRAVIAKDLVLDAIKSGARTQMDIKRATKLSASQISDCIAVLRLDEGKIVREALPGAHLWDSENWAWRIAA